MPQLFVYGTLRRGTQPARLTGFRRVTDDAPFPTIAPDPDAVVRGQLLTIPSPGAYDAYEGCDPENPDGSLYWRVQTSDDVWVYVGNPTGGGTTRELWNVSYSHDEVLAAADEAVVEQPDRE